MTAYITRAQIESFAETRETSLEIAESILIEAQGDESLAADIWQNAEGEQKLRIVERAWNIAGTGVEALYWGGEEYENMFPNFDA